MIQQGVRQASKVKLHPVVLAFPTLENVVLVVKVDEPTAKEMHKWGVEHKDTQATDETPTASTSDVNQPPADVSVPAPDDDTANPQIQAPSQPVPTEPQER